MMSASRRRWLMRLWMALSLILFAVTCSDRIRPYLKGIAGARDVEAKAAVTTKTLRLASWNLQFLDVGRGGTEQRSAEDYAALRKHGARLNADVIAVQEVRSTEALAQVFSPSVYAFYLGERGGAQRSGFVFKKSLATRVYPDLSELALADLRAGADLGVRVGAHEVRLLSIHLKAYCVTGALDRDDKHCKKLSAQVPVLESWVDARARDKVPFVVLGDFNRVLSAKDDALFRELDDNDPRGLTLRRASLDTHVQCRPGKRKNNVDHVLLGGLAAGWLSPEGLGLLPYASEDLEAYRKLSDHCPIHVTLVSPTMR